ncbi:chemotaxis protein CheW [Tenuibacillus multivorans]|uniref:Purine-binding chemotaxis protein CheW n=1 Tax=Tenuibacillus multivorans TaxID=237069 RepID=A0A1H0AMS9_9BACI|nr:chemotaxis protein CheW [Tenuibacillus multivorans]GEL78207.1 chemotaxis protein CheW [Tenuibacillus multivorans]SDN34709.1 purine-binding chemotaxis protein CheW [Tenuibacillus multivorans]
MEKNVVFRMRDEHFGVPIDQVQSIEKVTEFTKVPQAPNYIKGIVELRGEVTTVVDLRHLLDVGQTEHTSEARILIVQVEGLRIGLLVDEAKEVIDIDPNSVEQPPQMVGGVKKEYITGVAKHDDRLLILVHLKKVLDVEQIEEVREAVEA